MKKKTKKKLSKKFNIIKFSVLGILLISEILLGFSIISSDYLPDRYNLLVIIGLCVLFGISFLFTFMKKKKLNIVIMIISILLSGAIIYGNVYYSNIVGAVHKLINVDEEIETSYVFIVKSNSSISSIDKLEKKKIGILDSEQEILSSKITDEIKGSVEVYSNIGDMILGLQIDTVSALMVNKDVYELILSEYSDFNSFAKVLKEETTIKSKPVKIDSTINKKDNSFIVYISGVDNRETSSLGTTGLSDVNILAVINKKSHHVLLINIPRDYYVQLRGTSGLKDKLTHAGLYGINKSIGTVEDLFNIKINAYAKFNFKAVTTLVDYIGGITVYSDTAFNSSHLKGWYVKKGNNSMNGEKALAYARERYAYSSGDRHRGKNQEQIITEVIKKITTNKKYLLEFSDILSAIDPYFATNIDEGTIKSLVKNQIDKMPSWKVDSISVNGSDAQNKTYSWPNSLTYVMIPNQSTINTAKNKMYEVMREQ